MLLCGGNLEQRAHRLRNTALLADHAAHIALRDVQAQDDAIALAALVYRDSRGIIYQLTGQVLDKLFHRDQYSTQARPAVVRR